MAQIAKKWHLTQNITFCDRKTTKDQPDFSSPKQAEGTKKLAAFGFYVLNAFLIEYKRHASASQEPPTAWVTSKQAPISSECCCFSRSPRSRDQRMAGNSSRVSLSRASRSVRI